VDEFDRTELLRGTGGDMAQGTSEPTSPVANVAVHDSAPTAGIARQRAWVQTAEAQQTQGDGSPADRAAKPPLIRARDLSVHYGSPRVQSRYLAVRGVSFDLAEGEILAIVGESGSGKSTIAAAVSGYLGRGRDRAGTISGGTLSVLDIPVRRLSRRRFDSLTLGVGFLRQDAAEHLDPVLTVGENVALPIFQRDRRFNVREANAAVATLIDSVQLPLGLMEKLPFELSSGQRQRVALAKALILEPKLLVADEPTIGVDALVRDELLESLTSLQRERNFSAMVITSELSALRRLGGRVMVLKAGTVVGLGEIERVLDDPTDDFVKRLARARTDALDTGNTSRPGSDDRRDAAPRFSARESDAEPIGARRAG
jgi:ABC-type glutathione transport system ATPase component